MAVPLVDELSTAITSILDTVKILVGGLFGLYILEFFYRIFAFRKTTKQLKSIYSEIRDLKRRIIRMERRIK